MKISDIFNLDAKQSELDFIDIDVEKDTPLFIEPALLSKSRDEWSRDVHDTVKSFFQKFVDYVRQGHLGKARALFNHLHEPNETCLGLSKGKPRGAAIGSINADMLFDSIVRSKAVKSGVVTSLQDFRLFIRNIDKDKISDMITNIIRYQLITYTQEQCKLWNISLRENTATGFFWDLETEQWQQAFDEMLVVNDKKILLVPKSAVSFSKNYTPRKFYDKFLLEYLQYEHVTSNSRLIQERRDGTPYVTKKSLKESGYAPYDDDFLLEFIEKHSDVFEDFKKWITENIKPLNNENISDDRRADIAKYLIAKLSSTKTGPNFASKYHRLTVGIIEFLFYPSLSKPRVEQEINTGRKRIDIVFQNSADSGFFYSLPTVHQIPCGYIFLECKNYSKDVKNPELDQLSGRFDINRGRFGILLCRKVNDMKTLLLRCRDTYEQGNGLMLPIVDDDLLQMLGSFVGKNKVTPEEFLSRRLTDILFD